MPAQLTEPHGQARRQRHVDLGLSTLLLLQGFTLFVAIPVGGSSPTGRLLLDVCHLSFAIVCIGVLTEHRAVQLALIAGLALLVGGPSLGNLVGAGLHIGPAGQHELIAMAAFAFNGVVTALVARHVFGPGQVTVHRVRGAILLYLNIAALFAIADGAVATNIAGAFAAAHGAVGGNGGPGTASFSYFSLATITTTGYGDIVPVHPLARSLSNLEAVFGQLFPATLLTRLVTLHLSAERGRVAPMRDAIDRSLGSARTRDTQKLDAGA